MNSKNIHVLPLILTAIVFACSKDSLFRRALNSTDEKRLAKQASLNEDYDLPTPPTMPVQIEQGMQPAWGTSLPLDWITEIELPTAGFSLIHHSYTTPFNIGFGCNMWPTFLSTIVEVSSTQMNFTDGSGAAIKLSPNTSLGIWQAADARQLDSYFIKSTNGQEIAEYRPDGNIAVHKLFGSYYQLDHEKDSVGNVYRKFLRNVTNQVYRIDDINDDAIVTITWINNKVASVLDRASNTYVFGYSSANCLTQITQPDSTTHLLTYVPQTHLISTYRDYNAKTIMTAYYGNNMLRWFQTSLDNRFDVVISGQTVALNSALGNTVEYFSNGKMVERIDRGMIESYGWDSQGRLLWSLDHFKRRTDYSYDGSSWFAASIVTPDGVTTNYTYDDYGNIETQEMISEDESKNITKSFTYDDKQQLLSITDRDHVIALTRDDNKNITQIQDTHGSTTRTRYQATYDSTGRLLTSETLISEGLSSTTNMTYDSEGRLASVTSPLGLTHSVTSYNGLNEPETAEDYLGREFEITYDALGRVASETITAGSESHSTAIERTFHSGGPIASATVTEKINGSQVGQNYTQYDSRGRLIYNRFTNQANEQIVLQDNSLGQGFDTLKQTNPVPQP